MRRRPLIPLLVLTALLALPCWSQTSPKVGVLMLHGKSPGSAQDPNFSVLKHALEKQSWDVLLPDMPWSRSRYLQGNWDQAMAEIAGHVKKLKDNGAQQVVLVGHSMGVPAAMSHAARGGEVDALVLLAPGHIPRGYYTYPNLKAVRDSIDDARAKVAAGKGDETERFNDINQGRLQVLVATPRNYLSFFDPDSDADMGVTAPRIPERVPVLTVIGDKDPLFQGVRGYYVNKLPKHAKTQLLEIAGGHLDTPKVASEQLIAWIKSLP